MKVATVLLTALLLIACGGNRKAEPTAVPVPTFTNTPAAAVATSTPEPPARPPSRSESVEIILIPTDTPIPTQAVEPTATTAPLPTDTPVVLQIVEPTATPFVEPTATLAPPPTDTPLVVVEQPAAAVCECGSDQYKCGDFATHAQAQACYDYCMATVGSDIHRLDGNDNDGLACESLP